MTSPSVWQEVEFGSYGADLPFWVELADDSAGPGRSSSGAGAGRVALHLAGHGHEVIALERDLDLIRRARARSKQRGVSLTIVAADLASPDELAAATAAGTGDRPAARHPGSRRRRHVRCCSRRLRELIAPGGTLALTLVDESTLLSTGAASTQILPDMRELDGWVYSSEPLWVQVGDRALTVRRLRESVSPERPDGADIHDEILHRVDPEALEREAADAGFRPDRKADDQLRRERGRLHRGPAGGAGMKRRTAELRLLALYPEQMNIYADRGNIALPAAPLRVARDPIPLRRCRTGRRLRAR